VDPKLLLDPALELAEIIAQWDSHELPLTEATRTDSRTLFPIAGIPMLYECPAAFMEKRQPQWS